MKFIKKYSARNENLSKRQLNDYIEKLSTELNWYEFFSFLLILLTLFKDNISTQIPVLDSITFLGELLLQSTLVSQLVRRIAVLINYVEPEKYMDGKNLNQYDKICDQTWIKLDIKSLVKSLIEYAVTLFISTITISEKSFPILLCIAFILWVGISIGKYKIGSLFTLLTIFIIFVLFVIRALNHPWTTAFIIIPIFIAFYERKKIKKGNI